MRSKRILKLPARIKAPGMATPSFLMDRTIAISTTATSLAGDLRAEPLISRSTMSAVAKEPLTRLTLEFPVSNIVAVLDRLKEVCTVIVERPQSKELPRFSETKLGKKIEASMHGGVYLRIDLYNKGITQRVLAELAGIKQAHISLMIAGKRSISLENAQKFAEIFDRPADRYRHILDSK